MPKYQKNSDEIRRLAHEGRELTYAEKADEKIKKALQGKPDLEAIKKIAVVTQFIDKDLIRAKIKKFADLNLINFQEEKYPEEYDEMVEILEKSIKSIHSPYQKFIQASHIDYYDIAEAVYNLARKIEIQAFDAEGKETIKYGPTGYLKPIPIACLITAIEQVTDAVINRGADQMDRQRPFFFRHRVEEPELK
jgi:hypothetical protein